MDLDPEVRPETFTSLPGTREYMPPEAEGGSARYDPSLDVFSFGHLSLFTIIQSPVYPLLPSTYTDDDGLHARSEVKRREQYLKKAEQLLGEEHSLVVLVKQCLHNYPAQRPQTANLVTRLQDNPGILEEADGKSHSQPAEMHHLSTILCIYANSELQCRLLKVHVSINSYWDSAYQCVAFGTNESLRSFY